MCVLIFIFSDDLPAQGVNWEAKFKNFISKSKVKGVSENSKFYRGFHKKLYPRSRSRLRSNFETEIEILAEFRIFFIIIIIFIST